jgi:hypothetical protein
MEEKILKRAVSKNVIPVKADQQLKLLIYYKNLKLKSLLINNKAYKSNANSRVVYQYECKDAGCNSSSYIGYTICSLAKRFYCHVQSGAIHLHNKNVHNTKILTRELIKNTKVLYYGDNKTDLTIAEALLIKNKNPALNLQDEGQVRILKIF